MSNNVNNMRLSSSIKKDIKENLEAKLANKAKKIEYILFQYFLPFLCLEKNKNN